MFEIKRQMIICISWETDQIFLEQKCIVGTILSHENVSTVLDWEVQNVLDHDLNHSFRNFLARLCIFAFWFVFAFLFILFISTILLYGLCVSFVCHNSHQVFSLTLVISLANQFNFCLSVPSCIFLFQDIPNYDLGYAECFCNVPNRFSLCSQLQSGLHFFLRQHCFLHIGLSFSNNILHRLNLGLKERVEIQCYKLIKQLI